MTLETFKTSETLPELSPELQSLWYAAKSDWDKAHTLVQDLETKEAAWVHAYLHRQEGDSSNAGYWYRRAAKPEFKDGLEQEWEEIAEALLKSA
ncbi:MAG: hypothetical protein ACRCYY_05250 [Trueperaceae bacterium]